ncbi:hypothetical protein ACKKBG_A04570 [Auxenochlorella protothecoides x Auxenochlorella symbiontica]
MTTAVAVRTDSARRLLFLVTSVGRTSDAITITLDESLPTECLVPEGTSGCTLKAAAVFLTGLSTQTTQLLGVEPKEIQTQVEEYVSKYGDLPAVTPADLANLDAHLLTRTFIAGNALTLADLVTYAAVAPALSSLPPKERSQVPNLVRWYDHIHFTADPACYYPDLEISKPVFASPRPSAPTPAPAAAAGTAGNKEGAKAAPEPKAAARTQATGPEGQQPRAKKEKKAKEAKEAQVAAAPAAPAPAEEPLVDLLDLRVGKIVAVERHPNAESLYVETINLGEENPRQIVSGLVKFVPIEAMQGRTVVVVTNLKPAKMRDVMSYGMVLCASNDAHDNVDPIIVPEGVPVGERITFEGYTREPEAQLNPRKKQFEKIAPSLIVLPDGICSYKGVPFMTSRGPVTATIPGAHIA